MVQPGGTSEVLDAQAYIFGGIADGQVEPFGVHTSVAQHQYPGLGC
ncbi:MAG: hypothetical protein AMXMBFR56_63810 [Polyangiaceae bacterium]